MMRVTPSVLVCFVVLCLSAGVTLAQRVTFDLQVEERVVELLTIDADMDAREVDKRYQELEAFANTVASRAGARQTGAMVRCEGALGVLGYSLAARESDIDALMALFIKHPAFMDELGLLLQPADNAQGVIELARKLMTERSAQVNQFPALAAALCVVHDMQEGEVYSRRVNENIPEASDPLAIFDFFVLNAGTMYIRPDRLPGLALVYVVDVTETPEQLQWAHNRYRNNPAIKDRFFEIEYDTMHFQQNKPKRVTSEPGDYNLEKINRCGGVCADQTYYAMSVAKACGVPSAYVRARGADVSHAWVGFVEMRGRRASWNFDAGRYEDYQNLRGNLINPQTRAYISDGRAGILGAAMMSSNAEVLASLAASRVVERMSAGVWDLDESVELEARGNVRKPRTDSVDDRLALLRSTLSKSAGVPTAWDQVVAMAASNDLDQKKMDVWAKAVMQLAGRQHQDFAFDFLADLISTIDDEQAQHKMWEWAFSQFRARPDLAAAVRFAQGAMWAEEGNLEYAWLAYNDVINKFINDGPMVVNALDAIWELLKTERKGDQIIPTLENAAQRVAQPVEMSTQFAVQSNFYRIHKMLAEAYKAAGRNGDAQRVLSKIGE